MINIPQGILYAGHVVYDDGRVYKNHELLKTCASMTAAKRWATINRRAMLAEWDAAHHARIQAINARPD